jgi:hypothetical protein
MAAAKQLNHAVDRNHHASLEPRRPATCATWSCRADRRLSPVSLLGMTKYLAVFLFLTALCACSQQDKPITAPFSGPARSGPNPRTELERSKRICDAMGREFTLLDSPPNWRFTCESHGANSAGRSERTSLESSCSRKTLGASTEPQSPSEVSALVSSYLGCPSLFSAIDEIYQQEERDEGWATKLEEKIEQTAAAGGVRVKGVCRRSLCRIESDASQPPSCNRADVEFNHALIKSVDGTELQGDIIYWPTPTSCSRYFLSTVVPPAFLEPLRQRMGNGS